MPWTLPENMYLTPFPLDVALIDLARRRAIGYKTRRDSMRPSSEQYAMSRFSFLRAISPAILVGLIVVMGFASIAVAGSSLDPAEIKAVLRTTAEEEGGFIDRTIRMVDHGQLPRDIFDSCFIWARKKPKHKFQYFKRALIARAADAGITVH